jgi:4-amino-4-deoxy-L-arabinose transferase-like glycosyltransferase
VGSIAERPLLLLGAGVILAVCAFQLWITPSNPPGYHRDEASISYNAYSISRTLRDEDGNRLPLFFRSFDDYKSPLYPYLLAAVFRVIGPSKEVARGVSALLVLAAVLLLGLLARRMTGNSAVALVVVLMAGLSPWLFELGRIAVEASTQPLLIASLLLVLHRTDRLGSWRVAEGVVAGMLLGLLTYSYTGSRLLGPLLAAALVVFAGRGRWRWLAGAWVAFGALLLPLGVYALRHPHTLTARYDQTTIARNGLSGIALVGQAIANWGHDIDPWFWATSGDPAPYIHVGSYCSLFAATVALALAGVALVAVRHRADLWWRYVVLATALVPVPAALTVDRHNAIRLAALPVFVVVLSVPALVELASLQRRNWGARAIAAMLALAVALQFGQFLHVYRTNGPGRIVLFDAGVAPLLEAPFASGRPIYIDYDDRGAQAEARWLAVAQGLPNDRVVVLPDGGIPPRGSTVFGRFQECDYVCPKVARWDGYWIARAERPKT